MLNPKRTIILLVSWVFLCALPGYATDVKMSDFGTVTTLEGTDYLILLHGTGSGSNKKITAANALVYFGGISWGDIAGNSAQALPSGGFTGNFILPTIKVLTTGQFQFYNGATWDTFLDPTVGLATLTLGSGLTFSAGTGVGQLQAAATISPDTTVMSTLTGNQVGTGVYFTTGGTTTAYTLTPTPAISALAAGQRWRMMVNATNTAAATLAVSGKTATAIKKWSTAGATTDIVAGDMVINTIAEVVYDGTQYLLLNPAKVAAGSAAILATPRAIYGNNFDGSAALTQIIASTYGGTGNGFAKLAGPTTSEKTWTGPDANATLTTLVPGTITTSATPYPGSDGTVNGTKVYHFTVTALAEAAQLQIPCGTWYDGEQLIVRIKGDATPRALTYVTSAGGYRVCTTTPGALPTTTVASKTLYLKFIYNGADSFFDYIGFAGSDF